MICMLRLVWLLLWIATASIVHQIDAFVPSTTPLSVQSHSVSGAFQSRLYAADGDRPRNGWIIKNDFRSFLNQCTIQSFCFLLRQLRDLQTVMWVETFTQPAIVRTMRDQATEEENYVTGTFVSEDEQEGQEGEGKGEGEESDEQDEEGSSRRYRGAILRYHGLAAMNQTVFPTWEDYFLTLLQQPVERFWVNSTRTHVPNYEVEINPSSLCARMISVREQIAREWVKDLDVISTMGAQTMASYWENVKGSSTDTGGRSNSIKRNEDDEDNHDDGTAIVRPDRQNLIFLEWSPDDNDQIPSPLRKGNFDLLLLLSTQEAIHRVLNDKDRREGALAVTNEYLMNFYEDRLLSHFTGSLPYGRADDFLEELLATVPRMITVEDGNKEMVALIDPIGMVEMILDKRQEVAKEWRELARGSPDEHLQIRRMMLNRLMGIGVPAADEEAVKEDQ